MLALASAIAAESLDAIRWKRTYIQLLIICPSFLYAGAPFLATQLTGRACVFLFYNFDFAPVKKVCPEKLTPAAVA
jgi:hypothetical protein